jgi:iron complex outermembrane receptor protein
MFGNQAYTSYRPTVYNKDLTWETTKAFNVGLDFGFLNNRYTASIDFYTRKTEDLLATVTIPAGYNFNKEMLRNVGNVTSKGVEFSFNANVISTENWQWMIGGNATYQHNRITNLNGNNMGQCWAEGRAYQTFTEGYAPHTFYLYKQIYDAATGKPIEGMYADLNGDGKITEDDRYYTHHPAPDWIFGLTTRLTWKKWILSTSLRANVGNYVYNYIAMNTGAYETAFYINGQMNMLNASYLSTNFQRRQMLSDHYLENASFIKMDNLQLSYNFGKISKYVAMNMSFMVQNVFTITKYNGIDPEVNGGFDNTIYPRPRTYSFTIGVEF